MQSQNQQQQQQQQDPFDVFGSDDQDDNDDDEMLEPNRAATDDDGCAAAAAGAAARFMTTTQQQQQQQQKQQQPPHHRDPSCGPLVFHHGTEVALLQFVERNIMIRSSLTCTTTAAAAATTTTGQEEEEEPRRRRREERVIHLIDKFCYSRHWMMHIGVSLLIFFCRAKCRSITRLSPLSLLPDYMSFPFCVRQMHFTKMVAQRTKQNMA
jgi:hypothetical protein